MKVGLIIIGDEILSGKREDKHLATFIRLLNERGMQLAWAKYLGDDRQHITEELRLAFASGDLVISCGGIGATPDDHTRQAAALALGRPMMLHPQAKDLIWSRVLQLADEQGTTVEADHPDTLRRFEMGVFPEGAAIIPNPYNRIPGFSVGTVYFVPGFPVMAHPMMAWVLDEKHPELRRAPSTAELSLIVRGAMEASLTPLMEAVEAEFPGVKVFSLPSVDHPKWGRHIELGVKGNAAHMAAAYARMRQGVIDFGASIDAEMVR